MAKEQSDARIRKLIVRMMKTSAGWTRRRIKWLIVGLGLVVGILQLRDRN